MACASSLRPEFERCNARLPDKIRISCGWPASRALGRQRRIGECWHAGASADQTVEVFVSPALDCSLTVAATLVHELVHAAVGPAWGHRGAFNRLATTIGLAGPMRSTHAGPALEGRLNALIARLGPYPHARLDTARRSPQGTRLLKVVCPSCGYTARITQRWIACGLPVCPCGSSLVPSWHLPNLGRGDA